MSAVTYRVIQIERLGDTSRVTFHVETSGKTKMFTSTVPSGPDDTHATICTNAWQPIKNDVDIFITQVVNGTYLQGAAFVPQEDGSLIF